MVISAEELALSVHIEISVTIPFYFFFLLRGIKDKLDPAISGTSRHADKWESGSIASYIQNFGTWWPDSRSAA
jgi:hypothetical protein